MSRTQKMLWRIAPGFSTYEVSESGDLRRMSTGTRLRGHINSDGYPEYTLKDDSGRKRHVSAHRLVAMAFLEPPSDPKLEVAHCDGSRMNAHRHNLRWASRKSNSDDRVRHGTDMRGANNPKAKITEQDVREIRRDYREIKRPGSGRSVSELDAKYGLHRSTIIRIAKGRSWPHLPTEAV